MSERVREQERMKEEEDLEKIAIANANIANIALCRNIHLFPCEIKFYIFTHTNLSNLYIKCMSTVVLSDHF